MRILIALVVALVINSVPTAFDAEAQCQCVCRYGPYGRECRYVCRPRYTPPYQAPQQFYAQPRQVGPQIDPGLALGVAVILVVALVALFANAFNNDRSVQEIAAIEQSTASLQAGADEYERQARAIHEEIAAKERRAFAEGEAQAEREWEENRRRRS